MPGPVSFELRHTDALSAARLGTLQTPHGSVNTPCFMPVGTQATVKGLTIDQVSATGAEIILANTYHLALRPGADVVHDLGGLHAMSGWAGPILTDSGGFQIFSLAEQTKVNEEGATFRSHIDGRQVELSPERAVAIQERLGSDIAMVLDHVVALPNSDATVREAMERTTRWAQRCQEAHVRSDQALFAIVQGGLNVELRRQSARDLADLDFPGYAVGGLSVGETPEEMVAMLDATVGMLPREKPRYLMGVGRPIDLLRGIRRGIDMFDCVMPTRNGRNALAFTSEGTIRLRNEIHRANTRPLEEGCPCLACRHSRGYLRHLFQAKEMLGPTLVSHHNLTFYQRLLTAARRAIAEDRFGKFCDEAESSGRFAC